jgi:hypothetical protein
MNRDIIYHYVRCEMCRCVDITRCKNVCFPKSVAEIAKRRNLTCKPVHVDVDLCTCFMIDFGLWPVSTVAQQPGTRYRYQRVII